MTSSMQKTTLENGLVVATDRVPHFNGVAMAVTVQVGSVHEPEGKQGISHLLEHLIFRSTQSSSERDLQLRTGLIGAELNGCTNEGKTIYTGEVLKEGTGQTLELLGEMLSQPALRDEDIALEKDIVEQENCRGCSGCTMRDASYGEAYPDQSIRHPIIGYEDTIEAITRDDLVAYHQRHYTPGNTVVVVAGDVDHVEVVAQAERAFAELPSGPATPMPEFQFQPGEILVGSGGDRAAIAVNYDLTHLSYDAWRPFDMYSSILGGHGHSRLMEELREKRGLVYSCWTDWLEPANRCIFDLTVWGEARKMKEIAEIIADTMRATATDMQAHELDAAKQRARSELLMQKDNLRSRVERLSDGIIEGHGVTIDDNISAYMELALDDVRSAGQTLLEMDPVIFLGGSHRQMPKFDDIRARLKGHGQKKGLFGLRIAS